MKTPKSNPKGKQAAKRSTKDLPTGRASDVKGGSKIMANAAEMKKSLISNFPR